MKYNIKMKHLVVVHHPGVQYRIDQVADRLDGDLVRQPARDRQAHCLNCQIIFSQVFSKTLIRSPIALIEIW